ncbi:MAG: TerB family tellurite resistance protein [Nitratireductor sp.]|nr:TerB family tellurite resistance protein [Nitratireductor sp.]
MYVVVKQFLERLGSSEDGLIEYTHGDRRIAMAVLLFRVITIDGKIREEEVRRYREILEDFLEVTPDELDLFESVVREQHSNESSLFPFTTIVRKMPIDTKRQILTMMREISISDQELHEFEINLVARTAELLEIEIEEE